MASTYSNLKFELIGTGDQSGTWGTTTNTNLGTAIEQALVGMATISSGFTGSPLTLTLTLTDTNAAQNARALVLNLTQALGSAGTLNVPAIQKPYMIINATGQTVTVKVTGLTGVAVPTGKRAFLYNNGTDVGNFFNYADTLSLGTDLAVADGGTGASDAPTARTNLGATTVGGNLFTLTNPSAITFLRINADNTVSALSAADFRTAIGASSSSGTVTCVNTSNGPGPINGLTLTGGPITSTGTVTLGGGVNVSTITTGTLPVARGGTGLSCVGTSGNVLTSNGTAWVSQAVAAGGANIQSFTSTGTYTKPPGTKFVYVEVWGAGGGGGGGSFLAPAGQYWGAGGGGGGGYTFRMLNAPAVGATETVTIGAGGAAGTGSTSGPSTRGGRGGTTNFGTLVYAYGGKGGLSQCGDSAGGGGGIVGFCTCFLSVGAPSPVNAIFVSLGGSGNTAITSGGATTTFGFVGIWAGGGGGLGKAPISCKTGGRMSLFGGGGGGAGSGSGATPPFPGPVGTPGGLGRMLGAPPSRIQPNSYSPSTNLYRNGGGNGADPCASTDAVAGSCFNGGGGGGTWPGSPAALPRSRGAAGGIAGGGGGGTYRNCGCFAPGGAGGAGYVIVYSWS